MIPLRATLIAVVSLYGCALPQRLVAVGCHHQCKTSIASDGVHVLRCWGDNSYGQCGYDPDMHPQVELNGGHAPLATDSTGFEALYAGCLHTCVVHAGGAVRCWGDPASIPNSNSDIRIPRSADSCSESAITSMNAFQTCFTTGGAGGGVQECWGEQDVDMALPMSLSVLCDRIKPTYTADASQTLSATASFDAASHAMSAEMSESPTATESATATSSISASSSQDAEGTSTATPSESSTITVNATMPVTFDETPTATPSATASESATAEVTATNSPSLVGTPSDASTPSYTHTATDTGVPSHSVSVTDTSTPSQPYTPSETVTPSPFHSVTTTETAIESATITATVTDTGTPSPTNVTATPSTSRSVSLTATSTATGTPSHSAAQTGTNTPSRSNTASHSASPTMSASASVTTSASSSISFVPLKQRPIETMAAGFSHTNTAGQLGYTHSGIVSHPRAAGFALLPGNASLLAAGSSHTCVLDGVVICWGSNNYGQLGVGHLSAVTGLPLPDNVVGLVGGLQHTCAHLSNYSVKCWGDNGLGQLGCGGLQLHIDSPAAVGFVPLAGNVIQVVAGRGHTCALYSNGSVKCWGLNSFGQLGYGNNTSVVSPAAVGFVPLDGAVRQLVAGHLHTCAIYVNSSVKCWGRNDFGQLGIGNTTDVNAPNKLGFIPLQGNISSMAAGRAHTCGSYVNGSVKCWGAGDRGQLGYGNNNHVLSPLNVDMVPLRYPVIQLVAGEYHTCAMIVNGSVTCWGENEHGQLGIGTTEDVFLAASVGFVPLWD